MTTPHLRFTIRRMLIVILAVALLLTGYVKYRALRRREALILQVWTQIRRNDNAQSGLRAEAARTWRQYRAGYASREAVRSQWERIDRLKKQGEALQSRIAHLRLGD